MTRWLAIYTDGRGDRRSAMITPAAETDFPFGFDDNALGLADFDGRPVVLVEMPDDPEFRPMVVDTRADDEVPLQFIDL